MSEYEDSDIEMDDQSEDGEIRKSPSKKSPLSSKEKELDDNFSSISSEDEADTADSLDIKPPQAAIHHKDRSSGRKRDKGDRGERRSHKDSHRSKSHHRPREHREHRDREDRHREKRHHRERREARESRREARDMGRDRGTSSMSGGKERDRGDSSGMGGSSSAVIMEDLRERLDREKRRAAALASSMSSGGGGGGGSGMGRREDGGGGSGREGGGGSGREGGGGSGREGGGGSGREGGGGSGGGSSGSSRGGGRGPVEVEPEVVTSRERRKEEERRAPLPPPPPRETQREKAERVEKEKRRERLLLADREMVRQKEVWRRELEARRERRHLEQQAQERTLREMARQGERSREKMKMRGADEKGEGGGGEGGGGVLVEDEEDEEEQMVVGGGRGEGKQGVARESQEEEEEEDEEDDDEEDEDEEDDEEEEEEESEEERRSSSDRVESPTHMKEQEAVNLVTEEEEEEDEEDEEEEEKMMVDGGGLKRGGNEVEEGVWGGGGQQGGEGSGESGSEDEEEESTGGESESSTDTDEDADTDDSRHKDGSPNSKLLARDGERRRGSGNTNGDLLRIGMLSRKRRAGEGGVVVADDNGEVADVDGGGMRRRRRRLGEEGVSGLAGAAGKEPREEVDRDGIPYVNDESPKSDVVLREEGDEEEEEGEGGEQAVVGGGGGAAEEEEEAGEEEVVLPPYLPAIQGCRNVEEFQCLNRIEEGTYGIVYRARDKRTDEIVALKRLKMEKEKEGFPITSLREINTLLKAQHPNIVTVREIVVGSNMDKIFIVMDYVEHDLKSLMETMKQRKQVFIPGEVKCLMQQLLRAVAHLHDNWILHRDLKTSNLLLSHKGILKVGDFGLAREYGSPLKPYTPIVVTLWYRSPELLLCTKEYSTPVDMWSVGCIFGEFLSMEPLFPGKSEVDQLNKIFKDLGTPNERIWPGYSKLPAVQKMTFAEYPVSQMRSRFGTMLTDLGLDLMNRFLTYDPAQRITAEDALRHEYFKEAPLPIDPAMFPTWPAKSELGHRKAPASPKPPSGGREYKQLGDTDDDVTVGGGFHMGLIEKGRAAIGAGFSLKF